MGIICTYPDSRPIRPMDTPSPISLSAGLLEFAAIYMPARDLARKTREEYERDVRGLAEYLESRELVYWDEVELKHLQGFLAQLEKQQLKRPHVTVNPIHSRHFSSIL